MPRGKLEVVLAKGTDLKYMGESYQRPVMEFRVGARQRVLIDEDVKPSKAVWKNRRIEMETHS